MQGSAAISEEARAQARALIAEAWPQACARIWPQLVEIAEDMQKRAALHHHPGAPGGAVADHGMKGCSMPDASMWQAGSPVPALHAGMHRGAGDAGADAAGQAQPAGAASAALQSQMLHALGTGTGMPAGSAGQTGVLLASSRVHMGACV